MANEWTKVELYGANNDGTPRRYTIDASTAVSKGQLLQLTDPRTASSTVTQGAAIAGVASEDHKPNVASTSISCWTDGIFEAKASFAINIGQPWIMSALANQIAPITVGEVGCEIGGYVLATTAKAATVNVRLRL